MSPAPSPQASEHSTASQQLAEKIVQCIQNERQRYPGLTSQDVQDALRLAKNFIAAIFGTTPQTLRYFALGAAIVFGLLAFSLAFFITSR